MTGGPLGAAFGASVGHAFWDKGVFSHTFSPLGFFRVVNTPFSRLHTEATDTDLSNIFVFLAGYSAATGSRKYHEAACTLEALIGIHPDDIPHISLVFSQGYNAKRLPYDLLHSLEALLARHPQKIDHLLGALTTFLNMQGPISDEMHTLLEEIAAALGRKPHGPTTSHGMNLEAAYRTLGLPENTDDRTIRHTYRRLSRQCHPDIVAATGACPKEIAEASKRMASINAAWDEVARSRRMRR